MTENTFPVPDDPEYMDRGSIDRVPANVSFLSAAPNSEMPLSNIGFKWHPSSQHLSIKNFQPPSYYEDYLMTTSCSERQQALQKAQMEKIMALHGGPKSFVEIGCGDGSFLKYAKEHIPRILGIEPSQRFADEAIREGFDVHIGYVGSEMELPAEKFDAFVSRQVFEHLPDPCNVLTGIRKMLNPGAVGLIEVPNGQRALRLKRFFEFFPDHVNYYSVNSLVALASDAGFNAIACHEALGGDYLELWIRYEPEVDSWFGAMAEHRDQVCSAMAAKVEELSAAGKRIAIWGCGAKTLCILAASHPQLFPRIAGIIDSDPHKHGRFAPNTAIPIVSPDQGSDMNPDVVLVLALSYREEIAVSVRERIPSCTSILTLDDHGKVAELKTSDRNRSDAAQ